MANRQIWELTAEASPSTTFVLPIQKADGSVEAEKITIGTLLGLLPSGSVTLAKMADIATDRLIGRDTAGTGVPEALTVGGGVEFTGSGGIQRSALTGDVTASAGSNSTTIATAAVTLAKMADIATDRLIGRDTAGTGVPEALTVGGGVEFSGSGGIQRSALTGDVTASAGSNSTSIASNAVVTAKIADANVTLAKIANIGTDRLLGRDTASSGVTEELTVGGGLEFTGSGGIQRSALTGDVTASAGSNTTALASTVNANARVAVNKNSGATVGTRRRINFIEGSNVTLTIADDSVNEEVDVTIAASGGGGALSDADYGDITVSGTGTVMTIDSGVVTLAKMADIATDRLIGRDTAGTGAPEALTVGGGIEFTGSTGIQRSALTGDVTASAGSNSTTIATDAVTTAKIIANAVTYAKMQQVAALSVIANATNSTADPAALSAGSDHQVLRRSGTAIAFGAVNLAQSAAVTGTLDETNGGTGLATYTTGDVLYASASNTLSALAGVATGNALISGGVATAPSWGKVGLTTHISGTLAVGNGGTGAATLTGILKGNGTSAFTAASAGTDYYAPGSTDVAVADGGTGVSTLTGIVKGNGTSAFTAASAGTDYYAPGSTDVAVADGGTGASTAATARSNLGMANRQLTVLMASQGVPTQANGAAAYVRTGGSTNAESWLGFAFDPTTDEELDFDFICPTWFPGSTGVNVKFPVVCDATSNAVVFQASFRRVSTSEDVDTSQTYSFQSSGAVTVAGTAGVPVYLTIAFSSAQIDSFAAGEWVRLRIRRDADNTSATDSVTANDAYLMGGILVEEA